MLPVKHFENLRNCCRSPSCACQVILDKLLQDIMVFERELNETPSPFGQSDDSNSVYFSCQEDLAIEKSKLQTIDECGNGSEVSVRGDLGSNMDRSGGLRSSARRPRASKRGPRASVSGMRASVSSAVADGRATVWEIEDVERGDARESNGSARFMHRGRVWFDKNKILLCIIAVLLGF